MFTPNFHPCGVPEHAPVVCEPGCATAAVDSAARLSTMCSTVDSRGALPAAPLCATACPWQRMHHSGDGVHTWATGRGNTCEFGHTTRADRPRALPGDASALSTCKLDGSACRRNIASQNVCRRRCQHAQGPRPIDRSRPAAVCRKMPHTDGLHGRTCRRG